MIDPTDEFKTDSFPRAALDLRAAMTATLCRHLSTGQPLPPWGDVVEEARRLAYSRNAPAPTCKVAPCLEAGSEEPSGATGARASTGARGAA